MRVAVPGLLAYSFFVIVTQAGLGGAAVHGRIDKSGDAGRGEKTGTRAGAAWARDSPTTAHR